MRNYSSEYGNKDLKLATHDHLTTPSFTTSSFQCCLVITVSIRLVYLTCVEGTSSPLYTKTVFYSLSDDDFAIKSKYHNSISSCFNPYPGFQDANLWIMFYSILVN